MTDEIDVKLNKRSIKAGAKKIGDIGENEFKIVYANAEKNPDVMGEWDFMYDGYKVDVKTKLRKVDPLPHYNASVNDDQRDFDVDRYVFMNVNKVTGVITWCGWMYKKEYFAIAEFMAKGEIDPDNNFICEKDHWVVPYGKLRHNFSDTYNLKRKL